MAIEDVSLFLLKSIILKMVVGTKKTMFVRDLANTYKNTTTNKDD